MPSRNFAGGSAAGARGCMSAPRVAVPAAAWRKRRRVGMVVTLMGFIGPIGLIGPIGPIGLLNSQPHAASLAPVARPGGVRYPDAYRPRPAGVRDRPCS